MSWLSCCVALSTVLLFTTTADGAAIQGYGENPYLTLTWDTVIDDQYCEPYSWKDYELVVDEEHSHHNIIFEVFDRNQEVEGYKIDGLSIWIFEDSIPTDRESAFYQKISIDGILSLSINSYDAKQKTYWLSVQCSHERSEFQVLATYVVSELSTDGHSTHGIVCPGEWIYHHFVPEERGHVLINVKVNYYDLYVTTKEDHPPLRLVPPYFVMGEGQEKSNLTICDLDVGHDYYVGFKGNQHCAEYDVSLQFEHISSVCASDHMEEIHEAEHLHELTLGHFHRTQGVPNTYEDFHLYISAENSRSNLVIEVEDLSDDYNPQSLTVLLFHGEIADDRVSQHASTFSTEGLYSIALSANDLYEGDYYVSVRTGSEPILYRTIGILSSAPMKIQDHVAGVVCPGEFLYHFFDWTDSTSNSTNSTNSTDSDSSTDYSSSHRRALEMSARSYRTGGSGHRKSKEPDLPPALRRPGHIFAESGPPRHEPRNLQAYPQRRRRTVLEEVATQAEVDHSYDANLGHSTLTMEEIANYSSVNVSFKLKLHTGSLFYSLTSNHPPLKLIPPYEFLSYQQHMLAQGDAKDYSMIHFCDVAPGGQYYLGFYGMEECAEYDLWLYVHDEAIEGSCTEVEHICIEECEYNCVDLVLDHFYYDECQPYEIVDYQLSVPVDKTDSQLFFEAELLDTTISPTALSVYMYQDGTIPDSRETDYYSLFSAEGLWSLSIPQTQVHAQDYFFSVRCGPEATKYRVLAELFHSGLTDGHTEYGIVCPEQWLYHHFGFGESDGSHRRRRLQRRRRLLAEEGNSTNSTLQADLDSDSDANATHPAEIVGHATISLLAHTGDFFYLYRAGHAPVKLTPPFRKTNSLEQLANHAAVSFDICNVLSGQEYYVALYGGTECSDYEITLTMKNQSETCYDLEHDLEAGVEHLFELDTHMGSRLGSCKAYTWTDYFFNITHDDIWHNMVIEVEDTNERLKTRAITVAIWYEEIDKDRISQLYAEKTGDGIYAVSINAFELKEGVYYVGILCNEEDVHFRVISELFKGEVVPGNAPITGEVCPGEYVFHYYWVTRDPQMDTQILSGLLHQQYKPVPPNSEYVGSEDYLYYDHEAHSNTSAVDSHRLLQFPQSMDDILDWFNNVSDAQWNIRVHSGRVEFKQANHNPAMKMFPPYDYADWSEHIVGHGYSTIPVCAIPGGPTYLTLSAPNECSEYEIWLDVMDPIENCTDMEHGHISHLGTAKELEWGHFHLDECYPNEWVDFKLHVVADMEVQNVMIEVEDLSTILDTNAISVYLFEDEIPLDRTSDVFTDYSSEHLWTIAINNHDLHVGDYYVSVKCGPAHVRLRVLPQLISARLTEGATVTGEVCPNDWIYHYYDVLKSDGTKTDFEAEYPESNGVYHATFHLHLHTGDLYYLLRVESPPVHLTAPMRKGETLHADSSGEVAYQTSQCNLQNYIGNDSIERFYIGLRGGSHCSHYDLEVSITTGECPDPFVHEYGLHHSDVNEIEVTHFKYASCTPYSYVDFKFEITDAMEDDNIVIVVEDQSKDYNPDSLTLELYERVESIPVERDPDRFQDKSSNGLYSLDLNLIEVQAGTYFLSVRCGANAVPMRVVVNRLHGHVYDSQAAIAEVGPDSWVYHYVTKKEGKRNVQFYVYCYHGEIYYLFARKYYPPGFAVRDKNYYQYVYGSCDEDHKLVEVHVCDLPDDRTYLGLYGGDLLSEYAIKTVFYNEGDAKRSLDGEVEYFGSCEEWIADRDGYQSAGAMRAISVLTFLLSMIVVFAVA